MTADIDDHEVTVTYSYPGLPPRTRPTGLARLARWAWRSRVALRRWLRRWVED